MGFHFTIKRMYQHRIQFVCFNTNQAAQLEKRRIKVWSQLEEKKRLSFHRKELEKSMENLYASCQTFPTEFLHKKELKQL